MKFKLIIAVLLLAVGFNTANAQDERLTQNAQYYDGNFEKLSSRDTTTTDDDTSHLVFSSTLPKPVLFRMTNTKVSGTVSGTTVLEGSNSMSGPWYHLNGNTVGFESGQVSVDSLTWGDATATQTMVYGTGDEYRFSYYRLRTIYDGGSSAPTGVMEMYNENAR